MVDPKKFLSFSKVKSKKKKKKKKGGVLTSFYNFSYFQFQFSTFPFSIFFLFFSIFSPFPFFPCLFFPIHQQKYPGQKSLGALCPPHLLRHWSGPIAREKEDGYLWIHWKSIPIQCAFTFCCLSLCLKQLSFEVIMKDNKKLQSQNLILKLMPRHYYFFKSLLLFFN